MFELIFRCILKTEVDAVYNNVYKKRRMNKIKYHGLSTEMYEQKLKQYGPNEIEEEKPGFITKFAKWFISPVALMLLLAAILSFAIGDIFDFYFILFLMLINFFVGFWQEKKRMVQLKSSIKNCEWKLKFRVMINGHGSIQSLLSPMILWI